MRDASVPSSRAVSYFQEIRWFPMLEAEEEYVLALRWRDRGDRNAASRPNSSPSMEARLMPEVVYPLIYWPVGIALRGRLFFEIAKRM